MNSKTKINYFYVFAAIAFINIIFGFVLGANSVSSGIGWACAIMYAYGMHKSLEAKKK